MSNFPQNLSILRRRAGYTQEALAEALAVSRQAVGKWESGQALPEAATLPALADLLGCTLDQLMREELSEADALPAPDPEKVRRETERAVYAAYHAHMGDFARSIALGVFLVLAGVALAVLTQAWAMPEAATVAAVFLCLIVGIFLFITAGLADEDFRKNNPEIPLLFDPEEHRTFQKRFRLGVALCVAGILADAALAAILNSLAHSVQEELYLGAGFLAVMALCVTPLVYLGILTERYEPQQKDEGKKDLSGPIMLLATAGFLIWGLMWDGWRVSWVCFIIGAALCVLSDIVQKKS